jgi:hypothetical protein
MAIPNLTPEQAQYWGVIRGAAAEHLSTADLWQRIRDYEGAQNIARPADLFTAVSQMRSLATTQRTSVEQLAALAENAVLTSVSIAQEINARDPITRALDPKYYIRYEASIVTAEGEGTRWFTLAHNGILPATKGDVLGMVGMDVVAGNTEYEFLITGATGNLSITAY